MKIVLAAGWYYPDGAGGTEAYVAALGRWLADRGHAVTVAAPLAGAEQLREGVHDGLRVVRYPLPAMLTRDEARGDVAARGTGQFHGWLAHERPDVVHLHTLLAGLGVHEARAARAASARVFVTTHAASLGWLCERGTLMEGGAVPCDGRAEPGRCTACVLPMRGAPMAVASIVSALPERAAEMAMGLLPGALGTMTGMPALIAANLQRQRSLHDIIERFVVLTAWARAVVIANGAEPARVVLNRLGAVPPAGGLKPSPRDRPTRRPVTVGYIGRFDQVMGLDVLMRAMARVPADVPLALTVRGPRGGAPEQALRAALLTAAAHDARIRVEGAVERAAIGDALRALDVLVCPSRTAEGGPTIAIEAHAVGTPVIGSRFGGLAELVTDGVNGRLTPPGDDAALAESLIAIATDPSGTIDRWRLALPVARTMDDVAADTLAMYEGAR